MRWYFLDFGHRPCFSSDLSCALACWYDPLGWLFLESPLRQTEICISDTVSCALPTPAPADVPDQQVWTHPRSCLNTKNMWSVWGNYCWHLETLKKQQDVRSTERHIRQPGNKTGEDCRLYLHCNKTKVLQRAERTLITICLGLMCLHLLGQQ